MYIIIGKYYTIYNALSYSRWLTLTIIYQLKSLAQVWLSSYININNIILFSSKCRQARIIQSPVPYIRFFLWVVSVSVLKNKPGNVFFAFL